MRNREARGAAGQTWIGTFAEHSRGLIIPVQPASTNSGHRSARELAIGSCGSEGSATKVGPRRENLYEETITGSVRSWHIANPLM